MAHDSLVGCILGTAVGDALGLPYEGLSRQRASKLLGIPDRYRFLLRHGMISDDTEHTCMVAQSLIASGGDPNRFGRMFGWRLRWWLAAFPAGVGFATLRSILRLWCGVPADRSGVYSAGNGPAMRAAILGAAVPDPQRLRDLVRVSSRITHSDPRAESGAWAVALAARVACSAQEVSGADYLQQLRATLSGDGDEFVQLVAAVVRSSEAGASTMLFAEELGLKWGVSGFVFHSVPIALHAWLTHPHDYRGAVMAAIQCGGDTDSTAAMVGGIVGAAVGKEGIPSEWLERLVEWPRSRRWMVALGEQLSAVMESGVKARPIRMAAWGIIPRNVLFLLVVLFHGFRRLLPPY